MDTTPTRRATQGRRVNALAAYRPYGGPPRLEVFTAERTWDSYDLLHFLGALPWAKVPRVDVLDNASLHTSRVIRGARRRLAAAGIYLYFLPPYSPELNEIEKDQADPTSSDRWCGASDPGYDPRRRAARVGRVVPTTPDRDIRRPRMPTAARHTAPPRA